MQAANPQTTGDRPQGDQQPVTIITGAGSGIGAATARLLSERGHRVVLCGRRAEPLGEVAEETQAIAVVGDACTEEGAERAVTAALESFGRIDGLVLNAGVFTPGTADDLTAAAWNQSLAVNLTGPFLMFQAALPALRRTRGSVVSVSTIGALVSERGGIAYSASKAGLIALTRSLAIDHADDGIRANCVSPGRTRTEMSDEEMAVAWPGVGLDDAYARVTSLVPQQRAAESLEVAYAIAWLLSPESSYVTGTNLVVDGGSTAVDAGTAPIAKA